MNTVRAPAPVAAFSLLICLLAGLVGGFGVGYGIAQREANATLERIASTREIASPQPDADEPETLGNVSPTAPLQDAVSYARRGPANAKVEIVVFSDPRCPYCRQLAREVEPKLLEKYGDQIAITYRHFAILGEDSRRLAVALDCAGQAGKFWDYHALIYGGETPPEAGREGLIALAKQIGLDEARFGACLDAPNRQVDVDFEVARALRVRGTPASFVNGVRLNGALPLDYFTAAVDEQLRLLAEDQGGR
jgi:protein-disulfide isomerase